MEEKKKGAVLKSLSWAQRWDPEVALGGSGLYSDRREDHQRLKAQAAMAGRSHEDANVPV